VNVLMSGLDFERAVLCGGPLGVMAASMDVVLPYVHDRNFFSRPGATLINLSSNQPPFTI